MLKRKDVSLLGALLMKGGIMDVQKLLHFAHLLADFCFLHTKSLSHKWGWGGYFHKNVLHIRCMRVWNIISPISDILVLEIHSRVRNILNQL